MVKKLYFIKKPKYYTFGNLKIRKVLSNRDIFTFEQTAQLKHLLSHDPILTRCTYENIKILSDIERIKLIHIEIAKSIINF